MNAIGLQTSLTETAYGWSPATVDTRKFAQRLRLADQLPQSEYDKVLN